MRADRRYGVRLALLVVLLLALVAVLAGSASAVEFRNGTVVTIDAGEVIDDDLFISGSSLIVNGTVNGDLWATGSSVIVNGTVNGSLFFAGQSLTVNGRVTGSLYGLGQVATLGREANVGRNAYFAGAALTAQPGSTVGRDLLSAGNQTRLDGTVSRDVSFAGNALDINGMVGRNVQAAIGGRSEQGWAPPFAGPDGSVAPAGLRIGAGARIGGRLSYTSPVDQAANIKSQPAGGVEFRQTPERRTAGRGAESWAGRWFRDFLTLLALGALATWGLGAPIRRLSDKVWNQGALSLGWGVAILLAGLAAAFVAITLILIVGALLAAVTLGGLAFAVLGGAGSAWGFGFVVFILAVVFGSRIVISYLLGWIVLERLARLQIRTRLWPLLTGVFIYTLFQSIPIIGGWIGLAATLFGLGAIYLVWRGSQATPAPVG